MKPLLLIILSLFALTSAGAATNLPATTFLLDDKTVMNLTAGLKQYEDPPSVSGTIKSVGSGLITVLINRWVSQFSLPPIF